MQWLTRSDIIVLSVAAYVAVMTLVRMMKRRRDELVADVQRQVQSHRKRPRPLQDDKQQHRDAA